MSRKLIVRHTHFEDIEFLIELQKHVYPTIQPWWASYLQHQLEIFPQGQIIAEMDGQLVGAASSLIVFWDEWEVEHTWKEITARGSFKTHNSEGHTLYGAKVFVHPEIRGSGIGHALYLARRKICRQLNLKRIISCGRLPDYHHADYISGLFMHKKSSGVTLPTRFSASS